MQNPYPPVKVQQQDPALAKRMLGNIGGRDSEMSAVSLYFYNTLVTESLPELSGVFRRISMEEMNHLEVFGRLALALGADPRLWEQSGRKKTWWSPKYSRYTVKPRQIVSNALYGEYLVVEKYKGQLKEIGDPGIRLILERVVEEEQSHIRLFKELLQKI